MKLIIARHGETEDNVNEIIQGQTGGILTPKGREQTSKLALRLENEKIDIIYSSDLKRASDTAKEILKYHQDVPVFYTPLLRERAFGKWEGRPIPEWRKYCKERGLTRREVRPEGGGENFQDILKRVKRFMDELVPKHLGDTVLLVSHGGVIKCLYSILLNKPLKDVMEMDVGNTALCVAEVKKDHLWKVQTINCIEHLNV